MECCEALTSSPLYDLLPSMSAYGTDPLFRFVRSRVTVEKSTAIVSSVRSTVEFGVFAETSNHHHIHNLFWKLPCFHAKLGLDVCPNRVPPHVPKISSCTQDANRVVSCHIRVELLSHKVELQVSKLSYRLQSWVTGYEVEFQVTKLS